MTERSVIVLDRSGGDARVRDRDEPVKLRVCRACGRSHPAPSHPSAIAA